MAEQAAQRAGSVMEIDRGLLPDTVLTHEEVAKALRVSKRTVDKMNLPTVYVGRLRRYVWGMVIEVLKQRAA